MMNKEFEIVPRPTGLVYFEKIELIMLVFSILFCALPAYILTMLGLWAELFGFLVISSVILFTMFVYKPYARAKFIRCGGTYRLREGHIEFMSGDGKKSGYSITHMKLKVCRRGDRVDFLFGKNLVDFIKHYGSKNQEGVGLYSVDVKQMDDVLSTLKLI